MIHLITINEIYNPPSHLLPVPLRFWARWERNHNIKVHQAYLTTIEVMLNCSPTKSNSKHIQRFQKSQKHPDHPPKSFQAYHYQSIRYRACSRWGDCSRSEQASSWLTRRACGTTSLERPFQGRITTGIFAINFLKAEIQVFKIGVSVSHKERQGDIWHGGKLRNCFSSTVSWQTTNCSWKHLTFLVGPLTFLVGPPTFLLRPLTLLVVPLEYFGHGTPYLGREPLTILVGPLSLVLERCLWHLTPSLALKSSNIHQAAAMTQSQLESNFEQTLKINKSTLNTIWNMDPYLVLSSTTYIDPDSDQKSFRINWLWV